MATAIENATKKPDELADMLAGSVGCAGGCTYTFDGSGLSYSSGQCTGANCPKCPGNFSSSTYRLVQKLHKLVENPDAFTLNCSLISPDVPLLKLFEEYVRIHGTVAVLARRSKLYRVLSILLGVVSILLLSGLLYTLLSR